MKRLIARTSLASLAVAASAAPLLAWSWTLPWQPKPPVVTQVPEIDASTGALAVAAVFALLAFVAERRRKAR